MRILLAEDDELLGAGLRAGLLQQGFEVDWVRDGVIAEHELKAQLHQAAVLDLGLPRQDGLQVLQHIRQAGVNTPVLTSGQVSLDPVACVVLLAGEAVMLSHREFDVLHTLLLQAGRVLSRAQIEQHLYSWGHEVESNAVEVHIHHLRKKLGA
jgi:two-component system OmpR family response regulator/two-component system response regulator QseB